jgi:hypothetical protein
VEVIKWGILLALVLPLPFILGMIPVSLMRSSLKTPAMTYVCGWFVSFFVFEIVAMPFILLEKSFSTLVVVYTVILAIISAISIVYGKGLWKSFCENAALGIKYPWYVKMGWIVAFAIIIFQMVYAVFFEYYDGDDAYYVATAVITKTFNSMYLRDAYTGALYSLDVRHAFSPTPIYQAWLSALSHIHPAIVAHSVLGPVWLMFMYCIYGQIGNCLLERHKTYRPVFMILIAIWFMFGNISLYTTETFALTRTWQGKGMMAGMILPALLLCILYLVRDEVDLGIWILFICVCLSAVFATSVSFMLIPTVVGMASIIIGIRKKSAGFIIKMFLCCVPCMALAVCYIFMR